MGYSLEDKLTGERLPATIRRLCTSDIEMLGNFLFSDTFNSHKLISKYYEGPDEEGSANY